MSDFSPQSVRPLFPALHQEVNGSQPVFLDGPGGTQVPETVPAAMRDYLGLSNSNLLNSSFFAVEKTHGVVREARRKAADFVNAAEPETIVFGANMSTITAHLSRSLSLEWEEGDEIIVTALDHFSNVSFWQLAARDRGAVCHILPIHSEECTPDYEALERLISPRTKLVAFTLASNICGSLTDPQRIIRMARDVGALTFVDSVHYAPHFLPDVQALGCDFLACSAYKFFGPHLGFVCGQREHLERLMPYKVAPASDQIPDRWETGTKNFEALAGFNAAIDYLGSFYKNRPLRDCLKSFYEDFGRYEQAWSKRFLERSKQVKGMKIYGITDADKVHLRTSTFAFTVEGSTPQQVSDHLAAHNIITGAGDFYAAGVTEALALSDRGGIVRAGCVHYNTMTEMDRFFEALDRL